MDQIPYGQWGTDKAGEPSLALWEDGRVSGSDGCNRLMGTWHREGERIVFGPLASTMMYCQGVDTWLSQAASAREEPGQLVISNADGVQIGRLDPQHR